MHSSTTMTIYTISYVESRAWNCCQNMKDAVKSSIVRRLDTLNKLLERIILSRLAKCTENRDYRYRIICDCTFNSASCEGIVVALDRMRDIEYLCRIIRQVYTTSRGCRAIRVTVGIPQGSFHAWLWVIGMSVAPVCFYFHRFIPKISASFREKKQINRQMILVL